ncbi:MAG: two-component system sensor histidine kinase CreC [Holophagaceae bacterium]|nr:two-component system sensor histidine kinase CreC [Holophagaceae bacterium]
MRIGLRIFLGFLLIAALAAWFLARTFTQEVRPGVRQGMEVALGDAANLLAEVAGPELKAGTLAEGPFSEAVRRYRERRPKSQVWGLEPGGPGFRVYATDWEGRVVYDSAGEAVGQDYSRRNDVYLTLRGRYGARSTRADPTDPATSVMHVAAPILEEGRIAGVLTVANPTASVQPFAEASERKVMKAGLALMAAALLVGLGLTLWLTRAVNRLKAYAAEAAEGHKAVLPPLDGELAELGLALETMREKLEGRAYAEAYVHTLTHEMKSPLAAIRGAAELLEEAMPDADRRRFVANIQASEARLRVIIERMLDLAALQNRQGLKDPAEVDLVDLVARVLDAKRTLMERAGLSIETHIPAGSRVRGEAFLLEQALSNLLDNAMAFSPPGGLITVEAVSSAGCLDLIVRDQGPGLPDFALPRAFDAFYALPRPGSEAKGTGLGLAFVKEIAELHGGSTAIANLPEGGAEARIRLPRG